MTIEKRGVIDEGTPRCGCGHVGARGEDGVVDGTCGSKQPSEPQTEKQADDMSSSPLNSAIDAVIEVTDAS